MTVIVVVVLFGSAGCGKAGPAQPAAAGVDAVQDALASLRRAGTAAVAATTIHAFVDSGEHKELHFALEGTYQHGPLGDLAHVKMAAASTDNGSEKLPIWDFGDQAIGPNFASGDSDGPQPRPWAVYRTAAQQLEPLPLMAFPLLDGATEARRSGYERKDGVDLAKWEVVVPAASAHDYFGYGATPRITIDCAAGLPMTVWIDHDGRLRRVRLTIEQLDRGDTLTADTTFSDFGRVVGAEAAPPAADQIQGSIEQARSAAQQHRSQGPKPCTPTTAKPTGVDRHGCEPTSLDGFEALDRLGRTMPGGSGTAHYSFKQLTPAPQAFKVRSGLPVVDFMTKYIGPGGWELTRSAGALPPNFDPTDQAAVRKLLSQPEHGETAPADVQLLGISLKGTWAELAAEAADCRYERVSP